jgi:hypothetical protein
MVDSILTQAIERTLFYAGYLPNRPNEYEDAMDYLRRFQGMHDTQIFDRWWEVEWIVKSYLGVKE